MATLLENIQAICLELGLPSPAQAVGSTDLTALQLVSLMNRHGSALLGESDWQLLVKENTFNTVAYSFTGTVTNGSNLLTGSFPGVTTNFAVSGLGIPQDTRITSTSPMAMSKNATSTNTTTLTFTQVAYDLPADYLRLVDLTQYDKANRWAVPGSKTPEDWQILKSGYLTTGLQLRFRIMADQFLVYPYPTSGQILGYEYVSKNYVTDNTGAKKASFTADSDSCVFPDNLMILGAKKLFWQTKGFDTSIIERDYLRELSKYKAQQYPSDKISMINRYPTDVVNIPQNVSES